jgi:hypothetical protein
MPSGQSAVKLKATLNHWDPKLRLLPLMKTRKGIPATAMTKIAKMNSLAGEQRTDAVALILVGSYYWYS